MLPEDKFFQTNDEKKIWQRYCGFLDLPIDEYMEIQSSLLKEQIDIMAATPIGRKLMNGVKPSSIEDFRHTVPLTTYKNYETFIGEKQEDALAEKPAFWCHSSGRGGKFKWIPYSPHAADVISKRGLALFILATAQYKGHINFWPGDRTLLMLPPAPYVSGSMIDYVSKHRFSVNIIPPQDELKDIPFQERIAKGFGMSLKTGVDVISAIASVLVKMGEAMTEQAQGIKFSPNMLQPAILGRLTSAYTISKISKRPMLPKDLWRAKAIIAGGADASIYKKQVAYYWGQTPFETYAASEISPMATQAWNKKWLTLFPDVAFFEFIPEDELEKLNNTPNYQPKTVLLNEVEAGKTYELVITNFYGMPLMRYRLHDLLTCVALRDEDINVNLPQMIFKTRAEDIINLGGLAQIDERILWQAIENSEIKNEGWSACKEHINTKPILRIYIELKDEMSSSEIEKRVDQQLKILDIDYNDVHDMLGIQPIKVTLLSSGTFKRYYEEKQNRGADLTQLKPPHTNISNVAIQQLLQASQTGS